MELLNTRLTRRQLGELAECDVMALPSVACCDLGTLPDVSAVYFFIIRGRVEYIGQTAQLQRRWSGHHQIHRLKEVDGRVSYLMVPNNRDLRKRIELAFIKRLRPRLNVEIYKHLPAPLRYQEPQRDYRPIDIDRLWL